MFLRVMCFCSYVIHSTSSWLAMVEWPVMVSWCVEWHVLLSAPSLILLYHTHPSSKIREYRGIFFRKSRICIFLEKGGILVLTSVTLEKKGVILMSSVTTKKGVHFWLKTQCFIAKKGSFWAEKSMFCHKKGSNFQTGEQGWGPLFPVSEGAGVLLGKFPSFTTTWLCFVLYTATCMS